MTITLNETQDVATIQADPDEIVDKETVVLKTGEVIDYISAYDGNSYSDMIQSFTTIKSLGDKRIWATIKETTGKAPVATESISLLNWKNYLDNDVIRN